MPQRESFIPPLWVLTLLLVALSCYLIIELKEIVTLLVVGYCLAYIMDPGLRRLERSGVARAPGVILISAAAVLVLVALALTALPTLGREYDKFGANFGGYLDVARSRLESHLSRLQLVFPALSTVVTSPIDFLKNNLSGETIKEVTGAAFSAILGGYSLTMALVNLALLPFIVFYLAVDFTRIHSSMLRLVPVLHRGRFEKIVAEINHYISSFVQGQFIVATILFLLYSLGLGIVGVELWLLLAAISGFGNFIPYLGLIVGIVLSSLMAVVTFGDFWHVLQIWLVYAVVQFLEGSFITPRVVGEKVGVSPLVVILAVVAGGKLFGLLGILLAVPGAAALKVLAQETHRWVLARS